MQNVVFVFLLQRIVAAGGFVQQDRVDGELAVARAVGDSKFKQVCVSPLKTTHAHLRKTNSNLTASSTCFSE